MFLSLSHMVSRVRCGIRLYRFLMFAFFFILLFLCDDAIVAPVTCGSFVLGPSFVMQYFVPFLVLQSSRWGRER